MSESYSQTFRLPKTRGTTLVRLLLDLPLGWLLWFGLAMTLIWLVEKFGVESRVSIAVGSIFMLLGVFIVPAYLLIRYFTSTNITLTVTPEAGFTIAKANLKNGVQSKRYAWTDISGIEMVGTSHADGMMTHYKFHLYTSDGEELEIPTSMESFNYFVDLINQHTTHLPHSWKYFDAAAARLQGSTYGWHRVRRES